jgi:hypothetical protein
MTTDERTDAGQPERSNVSSVRGNASRWVGVASIFAGVVLNPWSLGREEGAPEAADRIGLWAIACIEAALICVGVWFVMRRPRLPATILVVSAVTSMVLAVLGVASIASTRLGFGAVGSVMGDVGRSERVLLEITPRLARLTEGLLDLRLPDRRSSELFANEIEVNELLPAYSPRSSVELVDGWIRIGSWPVEPTTTRIAFEDWEAWGPWLQHVERFEHASFLVVTGELDQSSGDSYDSLLSFQALAVSVDGARHSIEAKIKARWIAAGEPDEGWRMNSFLTDSFVIGEAADPLFEEVRDRVLVRPQDLERARGCEHQDLALEYLLAGGETRPRPGFTLGSGYQHPGLSVCDVDDDGWDDLYVMARWGANMLLRNQGNGELVDEAREFGLDIEDYSTSAVFADLDNDGDQDAVIGRSRERSQILDQVDGVFVERPIERSGGALPFLVTSVAVADWDNDGLLDIYLSTDGAQLVLDGILSRKQRVLRAVGRGRLLGQFLSPEESRRLSELASGCDDPWLDRPGPPNVALEGAGGGNLMRRSFPEPMAVWRNTLQSTFCDVDDDGDVDLYVANDFGPNVFLRNDGGGAYSDVTAEMGTADIGFGMGASFGDYDLDGRQDLYVTNMYSKAGLRVTRSTGNANTELERAARGNSLFRNTESRFELVSGSSGSSLRVEKGGWGWGGQFVDVDNDGYLDIHSLSGFYTAPPEIAKLRDT